MSFLVQPPAPRRRNRSQLVLFADRPETFAAATGSVADVIMFELEDNVPPDDKPAARKNIIEALNDLDWGDKSMCVRVNGLDTPHLYRDLVDLLEAPTERLDLIMIPKAGNAADIYAVDAFVTQIETAMQRKKPIGFQIMIETAQGMNNIDQIAAASPRNDSLHMGTNDYVASVGARAMFVGGPNPDYSMLLDPDENGERDRHFGDMWNYHFSKLVAAARAHGLNPVDAPFGKPDDLDGFRAASRRVAALGCVGKWGVREAQIEIANQVFAPSPEEIANARRILAAAAQSETGQLELDGKPIRLPHVKKAEAIIEEAEKFGI